MCYPIAVALLCAAVVLGDGRGKVGNGVPSCEYTGGEQAAGELLLQRSGMTSSVNLLSDATKRVAMPVETDDVATEAHRRAPIPLNQLGLPASNFVEAGSSAETQIADLRYALIGLLGLGQATESRESQAHDSLVTASKPDIRSQTKKKKNAAGMTLLRFWLLAVPCFMAATFLSVLAARHASVVLGMQPKRLFEVVDRSVCVRFDADDDDFESEWKKESHDELISRGATVMCVSGILLVIYRVLRLLFLPDCLQANLAVRIIELIVAAGEVTAAGVCIKYPDNKVFWSVYIFMTVYVLAMTLPPFQWSCSDLVTQCGNETDYFYIQEAVDEFDCSLQGQTAESLFMSALFVAPWVVPYFDMLHILWAQIITYVVWSTMYNAIPGEGYYGGWQEILLRGTLLAAALFGATFHKYQYERNEQQRFRATRSVRRTTMTMYRILANMLPAHVIPQRLRDPDFDCSERVGRASVMFVDVENFNELSNDHFKSSEDSVRFLHFLFTRFDDICEECGVMKIESVKEVYVCCVGVSPEDQAPNCDYGSILTKLVRAAEMMLCFQTDEVKLKIGIHTGPLVAGVIGKTLPRYRLFGDTMNVAARMYQKGATGKVQFGQETKDALPSRINVEDRGVVEMKGKGPVQVYWIIPGSSEGGQSQSIQDLMASMATNKREVEGLMKSLLRHTEGMRLDIGKSAPLRAQSRSKMGDYDDVRATVDEIAATTETVRIGGCLSAAHAFTGTMEEEWQKRFHQDSLGPGGTCKQVVQNFSILAVGIALLSLVDLYLVFIHGGGRLFEMDHDLFSARWHMPLYAGLRLAALLILASMSAVSRCGWFREQPALGQAYILGSLCCVALLLFFSYEALTVSHAVPLELANKRMPPSDKDTKAIHLQAFTLAFKDQQLFPVLFVLVFFLVMRTHSPMFRHSFVFVPLAVGMTAWNLARRPNGLYLSWWGSVLFVVNSGLNCLFAHSEEQSSRMQFKSQHYMEDMQKRVDGMLSSLMPKQIVESIRDSGDMCAVSHRYEHVTVAQSDLVGFTKLSSSATPAQGVGFITDLFGRFDVIADRYGIYKIETVGDAYQAGMAEKLLTDRNSPSTVVLFGVEMVRAVAEWCSSQDPPLSVECRVGVHHSACTGGVVGTKMQRYHLFGEIMEVVDVLEATGLKGGVQVSTACQLAVETELACQEGEPASPFTLKQRNVPILRTSKGEEHTFDEVGGRTYVVAGLDDIACDDT